MSRSANEDDPFDSDDSDSDEEVVDYRDQVGAGPASPSQLPSSSPGAPPSQSGPTVSDLTPYKKYVNRVLASLSGKLNFTIRSLLDFSHELMARLDGLAYIRYTWMQNAHTGQDRGALRGKRRYGGL